MVELFPNLNFMYEYLARGRLCEHFDRNRVMAPSATIHFAEKPNSDLRFKVDLVPSDSPARQAQFRSGRQPPESIYPRLDKLAVERVRTAPALHTNVSQIGRPLIVEMAFLQRGRQRPHGALVGYFCPFILDHTLEGALQGFDCLRHIAARDLQHVDHRQVVVLRERRTHQLS